MTRDPGDIVEQLRDEIGTLAKDAIDDDELIDALRLLLAIVDAGCAQ